MTRILLLDDDLDLLNIAKSYLSDDNPSFELITTHSPAEALQKVAEEQFDVMVSDYLMPAMDGLALLKKIREEGNDIPFIMFTGHGREEVAMQALNLGADYYLMKSDEPGSLYGELAHIIHRVIEHKQMEQALRESEEKYRTILETIQDGYFEIDLEGNFTFFNAPVSKFLRCNSDELMGMNFQDFMNPETAKQAYQTYYDVYQSRKPAELHSWNLLRKDGSEGIIEARISLMTDSSGKPIGFRGTGRDITERKQAEHEMQESEQKYRELVEELHEGILVEDADEIITFVNPQTTTLLGYSFEELIGQPTSLIIPDDEKENIRNETAKRPLGISSTYESALMTKEGRRVPVIISTTPLFFESGEFRGILSLFTDITERKRVEELLRDNEERFRRLTEQNLMGIVLLQDGQIKYANQACSDISGGYSIEELMTWNQARFLQIIHPEDRAFVAEQAGRKQAGIEKGTVDRYSLRIAAKGGKIKRANVYSKTIIYQGKPADFVMLIDVTEQKQAEETLRESEERYRSLFHFSNDGIFIHDLEGKIIDMNQKALEMLGYSRDELLALTIADMHPQDMLEKSQNAFAEIARSGYVNFEIDFQKKSGEIFSADVSSSIFEIGGEKVVQGLVRDISDRKEIEQQLQHEREELSQFAHTLGHDLRNYLHSIQGHASLIRREYDLPRAEKIINLAQRMNRLLARSLALADAGLIVDKTDRISIAEIAQKVAELTIPEGITIFIDLDPIPEVLCDRERVAEVFQNLFENAIIHGKARKIYLTHVLSEDNISITIRNDGKPIPSDLR
ncbi:MAG: PAS domain S-box protein, partial [Candidatus Thorarchaeota archaeon]